MYPLLKKSPFLTFGIFLLLVSCNRPSSTSTEQASIRFASYNVALFRKEAGQLAKDLQSKQDSQIQNVAAVIQNVRPDVLALMEFDYDPSGRMLQDFQQNYLAHGQHGEKAIHYPYQWQAPSNTGIPSEVDYNQDGKIELPNDAFGYGKYEGQYAFCILSKFPIDTQNIRSYQKFLWKDLPAVKFPANQDGSDYYSPEATANFRLSSKNHVSIPIALPEGKIIHSLLAHPTPPVFDGPEDRNGLRNQDEIRLLKEMILDADFLVDDRGSKGGLNSKDAFVVMGDLNADPIDGDSSPGAIQQLLNLERINQQVANGNLIPKSKGGKEHNKAKDDQADPSFDTSFFGKRIDYVLPSRNLEALASGVFWPASGEALFDIVKDKKASDHLLVWVDILK